MGCMSSKVPKGAVNLDQIEIELFKDSESFIKEYTLGKQLGSGSYSVVHECVKKSNPEKKLAVKCMTKANLEQEDLDALITEVENLKNLKHPSIMQLVEYFDETAYFFLVSELVEGGDLLERILERERYTEEDTREVIKTLLEVMGFCHKQGVVHRDLKPDNLLLMEADNNTAIKLVDFGFSRKLKHGKEMLSTACGTLLYAAPEIISEGNYDGKATDVWSIGVITYVLLCGFPPFFDDNEAVMHKLIKTAQLEFTEPAWQDVSDLGKQFIRGVLDPKALTRPTCDQLLQDPWITTSGPTISLTTSMTNMRNYKARRKFKGLVNTVIMTRRLSKESDDRRRASQASQSDGVPASIPEGDENAGDKEVIQRGAT